jgi:hypothetical protein
LNKLRPGSELPGDLQKLYLTRFTGHEDYRNLIWQVLTSEFFSRWVHNSSTILDLGRGYGEFINNVSAGKSLPWISIHRRKTGFTTMSSSWSRTVACPGVPG